MINQLTRRQGGHQVRAVGKVGRAEAPNGKRCHVRSVLGMPSTCRQGPEVIGNGRC